MYEGEWRVIELGDHGNYKSLPPQALVGIIIGVATDPAIVQFIFDLRFERAAAVLPPLQIYGADTDDSFELVFNRYMDDGSLVPAGAEPMFNY